VTESFVLKARHGKAVRLSAGACVTVVNVFGQQVVDTWALCASDPSEAMSMEHTRSCLDKLAPTVGDNLFTDCRRAILRFVADSSPGVHDTLLSACDEERYRLLGVEGKHGSCAENFALALAEVGVECPRIPGPWNLFENVTIGHDARLSISPPRSRPGDRVVLRALIDAIVVFSACPMDIALTNGLDRCPRDVELLLGD
jgi:uncharacterized protein YcgI (DUF1989 family)